MLRKTLYTISTQLRRLGIDLTKRKSQALLDMERDIRLKGGINFKIEFYPDGSWVAESKNVEGIITGGKNAKDMDSIIKDAVFTYYEIPPFHCNDLFLKAPNEPITIEQTVLATR